VQVDLLVREVVVDAPAQGVELRQLQLRASAALNEGLHAVDVQRSLEVVAGGVDLVLDGGRHLQLALVVLVAVQLDYLADVDGALLELRHELVLEHEEGDDLERLGVEAVGVLVLDLQQLSDLLFVVLV
jgi:hypothetical protein